MNPIIFTNRALRNRFNVSTEKDLTKLRHVYVPALEHEGNNQQNECCDYGIELN